MKDREIIALIEDIILIKVGKEKQQGFYARVNDVVPDYKKGWWRVRLSPLVTTPDFELLEIEWKLDNDQIKGEEFTMNGVPHQLFKVDFINYPDFYQDDPVPLPRPISDKKKPTLTLVK